MRVSLKAWRLSGDAWKQRAYAGVRACLLLLSVWRTDPGWDGWKQLLRQWWVHWAADTHWHSCLVWGYIRLRVIHKFCITTWKTSLKPNLLPSNRTILTAKSTAYFSDLNIFRAAGDAYTGNKRLWSWLKEVRVALCRQQEETTADSAGAQCQGSRIYLFSPEGCLL